MKGGRGLSKQISNSFVSSATFCSIFGICSRPATALVESVCGVVHELRLPREGVHVGCVDDNTIRLLS